MKKTNELVDDVLETDEEFIESEDDSCELLTALELVGKGEENEIKA